MILRNSTFEEFAEYVMNNNKKIVFFGAGTLLATWIPYVIDFYKLKPYVIFCVDNNKSKWNTKLNLCGEDINIYSPEVLQKNSGDDIVIVITSSYFSKIVEQLDSITNLNLINCYIAPVMHISHKELYYENSKGVKKSKECRIPKLIHYCWFGKKTMPDRNQKCIESWRQYCPDYEIVEWNEDNYDVNKNLYMSQAYEAGRYGYVPDYARIDLLCEYGGLYFDTDVEIIRNIDDLLYQEAFCSFEEYPTINVGGGSGSVKSHPAFLGIREFREKQNFINPDGSYNLKTCGYYETIPLIRHGLRLDGTMQNVQGITVYPSDFFHPKSSVTGRTEITKRTYSIHQFNWSWVDQIHMDEKMSTHKAYQNILERVEKEKMIES